MKKKTAKKAPAHSQSVDPRSAMTPYAAHAMLIFKALCFIKNHWSSYTNLIPLAAWDEVEEEDIERLLHQSIEKVSEYALRVLAPDLKLSEELYAIQLTDSDRQFYLPIESLVKLCRIFDQTENEIATAKKEKNT